MTLEQKILHAVSLYNAQRATPGATMYDVHPQLYVRYDGAAWSVKFDADNGAAGGTVEGAVDALISVLTAKARAGA